MITKFITSATYCILDKHTAYKPEITYSVCYAFRCTEAWHAGHLDCTLGIRFWTIICTDI